MTSSIRWALAAIAAALVLPGAALAGTSVGQLFPSNIYTAPDATQVTVDSGGDAVATWTQFETPLSRIQAAAGP